MSPFTVALDRWGGSVPRRRRIERFFPGLDLETAHLVVGNRLDTCFSHTVCLASGHLTDFELVLLVSCLSDPEPCFAIASSNAAVHANGVAEVCVMTLIERTQEAESRLDRHDFSVPLELHVSTDCAA